MSTALGTDELSWPKMKGFWLAMFALAIVCFAIFSSAGQHQFISLDDADYVQLNPMVNQGFTWRGLRWAFTEYHSSNWHPITWMGHMLDAQLFGLNAGRHHLMSAAWHTLNACLCLLVFVRLSDKLWPSLLLAGLFALHPQRVESVAWVSERKDLLAGCFFFLTILAHLNYVRAPGAWRRLLVLLAMTLGLLSKPSVIMLPLLLVMIDLFPIDPEQRRPTAQRQLGFQLREKWPLFALAAASALVTWLVQGDSGAVSTDSALHLGARISNAFSSYGSYLLSCLVPFNLAYFYPHPALVNPNWSPINTAALLGLACLLGLSAWFWRQRHSRSAAWLGWCWFLLLLVPMIGIVQVGEQARADRYSYLSSLGLYTCLCFGFSWRALPAAWLRTLGAALLLACGWRSLVEIRFWSDSMTLYRRAAQVTENNYAAALGIANLHNNAEELAQAKIQYIEVLRLRPKHPQALYSYGLLAQKLGDSGLALELYGRAIQAAPEAPLSYLNLAYLLASKGRLSEAIAAYGQVVRREIKGSPPRRLAATYLSVMGRDFQARLKTRPGDNQAQKLLQEVQAALYPDG